MVFVVTHPGEGGTQYGPAYTDREKLERHYPRSGMQESTLHVETDREKPLPSRVFGLVRYSANGNQLQGLYPRVDMPVVQHHPTVGKGLRTEWITMELDPMSVSL